MENKSIYVDLNSHNYVRSYGISYYENGIITVTINTHKKWIPYSCTGSNSFDFGEEDGYELHLKELNIPKYYTYFHTQNKDQIVHLWLPSEMMMKGLLSDKIKRYRETGIDLKQQLSIDKSE